MTAVASCSVPVFDAVSMTAKTPSQLVGYATGWPDWLVEAAGPGHLKASNKPGRVALVCRVVSLRALAALIAFHPGAELVQRHGAEHRYPLAEHPERAPRPCPCNTRSRSRDNPRPRAGKSCGCLPSVHQNATGANRQFIQLVGQGTGSANADRWKASRQIP